MLVINLKAYKKGKNLIELAKLIKKVTPKAIVGAKPSDIKRLNSLGLNVYSQYFSEQTIGARGSFINHNEHPLKLSDIKKTISKCKKLNLKTLVFSSSINQTKAIAKLNPWAIAYEDQKLIGSRKSITEYRTKEVKEFANLLNKTKIIPICGAGIHSAEDYKQARKLGCNSVAISSAIANQPLSKAEDLLKRLAKIK